MITHIWEHWTMLSGTCTGKELDPEPPHAHIIFIIIIIIIIVVVVVIIGDFFRCAALSPDEELSDTL
jgi:membrane protein DedA with SNARE-associated domain